ncbi:MAG: DUF302 domain-containing protein [Lentimicrobiaceae bacterium]|jgi:uncharacterized protein (DUF302 family)|nr:DUF302 domain-containing protein [Lentimicrobiaceae bacterium]MCP4910875.1 DUF302 domain-containing protein [Bacteroidota bacterium]MBT3453841.1 DUF302 domain-containing protein [Lentimicrobiaceae bacterium]MBT3819520.1 DUF302 domain-containing protein [Lentimicrobiaceae bacterium]MBT4061661.1 DUF302 domain-containing protein [Lentimicrobiaceae bacterium]
MEYFYSKMIINASFEEIESSVREELKQEGFGVLTEINVQQTLKKKLDVDFKRYIILGACIPEAAYKLLQQELKAGVFLPCNIILEENDDESIEVSAINPVAAFSAVDNDSIGCHLEEIQQKLMNVIDNC